MTDIPDLLSGRTCREPSPPTKGRISPPSSRASSASRARPLLTCLSLHPGGQMRDALWQADARLHGVYSMRNISASPNDAAASTLSQILQADPHPRFFLSPRAAQGILNRAARKNKTMPTPLKQALEAVAAR